MARWLSWLGNLPWIRRTTEPQPDPPAPFTIIQTAVQSNIVGNTTQALPTAIAAGDLLILTFAGRGFGTPPQAGVVSSVSDNVNGAWTQLYNTGNLDDGASHNWCSAVFYVVSQAAPSGVTVTINSTAGQGPSSIAVVEYRGGATSSPLDVTAAQQKDTTDASGNLTTPATAAAQAGDLVLFVAGGYSTNAALTVPGTQTMDATNAAGGATNTPVGISSRNTLSSAGETPTGTFSGFFAAQQVTGATILVLQPAAPPAQPTASPTDLWRQEFSNNASGYTVTRYSDVFREVQFGPSPDLTEDSWNIRLRQDHRRFF